MTTTITLKDSTATDRVFNVVRQAAGRDSAVLLCIPAGAGMNRTAALKLELSSKIIGGSSRPVATVAVPYGAVIDGNFVKRGQVSSVHSVTLPSDAPELARADAEALSKNLLADPQIIAMVTNGYVS